MPDFPSLRAIACSEYPSDIGSTYDNNNVRYSSKIDIISQIVKIVLDLVLWPILSLLVLGNCAAEAYKQAKEGHYLGSMLRLGAGVIAAAVAPPCSAINRLKLIGYDVGNIIGRVSARDVAIMRSGAFTDFPTHNKSPMRFSYDSLRSILRPLKGICS